MNAKVNNEVSWEISREPIAVAGARASAAQANIRYQRPDIALIELVAGSVTAVVLTQNRFIAAPVKVVKTHIQRGGSRYLLINSGCANAGLGDAGLRATQTCCEALGKLAKVETTAVLPFSTGVIGEPLPTDKVTASLPALLDGLGDRQWRKVAAAIMTTDTFAKVASVVLETEAGACNIVGVAKGSGMIAPNMATMLGFIVSDVAMSQDQAQSLLVRANEQSFNSITVDGDTSTNDACTLSATAASGVTLEQVGEPRFYAALEGVMQTLADDIVRDGEGATRMLIIQVDGAVDEAHAREVARTVALSPLVKTAVYGQDPNWGRFVAAIGRAPVAFDFNKMRCWIGEQLIFADGQRASSYSEEQAAQCMRQSEWILRIALSEGNASAIFKTCDFSTEYVTINASYRS